MTVRNLLYIIFFITSAAFAMQAKAGAAPLADTNQQMCYDGKGQKLSPCPKPGSPLAQDGTYQAHPPSFTNNEDGTVTDDHTGLIWQQCSAGQGAGCEGDSIPLDFGGALYYCEDELNQATGAEEKFAGTSLWRLPTKKELLRIIDWSKPTQTINTQYFPNSKPSSYWTSTECAGLTGEAWIVIFQDGHVFNERKYRKNYVRCVKDGATKTTQKFTDNKDGTVTDTETSLIWQKCSRGQNPFDCTAPPKKTETKKEEKQEPKNMGDSNSAVSRKMPETRGAKRATWAEALTYCETEIGKKGTMAGFSDWRLPNVVELESLSYDDQYNPTIDTNAFPNSVPSVYWTSTTYAAEPTVAWSADLFWGRVYKDKKDVTYYVRCVRGGE